MVCTITSANSTPIRQHRRARASGATLVEFLVGMTIAMIVIGAVLSFAMYSGRSIACAMNYVELESQSRNALDHLSREIRRTTLLTAYSSNHLSFQDYDGLILTYNYSPSSRTLSRIKQGVTNNLLTGCDALNFSIFQRSTTNGTYDQYPTSLQASNCKVVLMTWSCSRNITGTKLTTETVQTAKIVIRNQ